MNICSEDDDDIMNDTWIYTVRASLNDNERQSQHYEELESVDSHRQPYAPMTPYADRDVKPRQITVIVSVHSLLSTAVLELLGEGVGVVEPPTPCPAP